jgi:hypothetical protein
VSVPDDQVGRLDLGSGIQSTYARIDRNQLTFSVRARLQVQLFEVNRGDVLQPYRPPRPDCVKARSPARNAPKQCRAEPAQLLLIDEIRLPPGTRPFLGKSGVQTAEGDQKLVFRREQFGDVSSVCHEHVARAQDRMTVEPHVRERRQTVEAEPHAIGGRSE